MLASDSLRLILRKTAISPTIAAELGNMTIVKASRSNGMRRLAFSIFLTVLRLCSARTRCPRRRPPRSARRNSHSDWNPQLAGFTQDVCRSGRELFAWIRHLWCLLLAERPCDRPVYRTHGARAEHERGLGKNGALIPWTRWGGGAYSLTSSVCQVEQTWQDKALQVAAARVEIKNLAKSPRELQLYVALRPLGAAGGTITKIAPNDKRDAILVDGHLALWAEQAPTALGVSVEDDAAESALQGRVPTDFGVGSSGGACSGLMRYDLRLPSEGSYELGFICPVMPGRPPRPINGMARVPGRNWTKRR